MKPYTGEKWGPWVVVIGGQDTKGHDILECFGYFNEDKATQRYQDLLVEHGHAMLIKGTPAGWDGHLHKTEMPLLDDDEIASVLRAIQGAGGGGRLLGDVRCVSHGPVHVVGSPMG